MNDERPIEKLLRRYAKKRGDEAGPPPELHPATRRLLQGEVARQFPKPGGKTKPSAADFFTMLTRRWIYAVGVFVVLGVAVAMFLPALNKSKEGALLAQKSSGEELLEREIVPPVSQPTLAPTAAPVAPQPTLIAVKNRRDEPAPEPSGGGNYFPPRESAANTFTATNGIVVASRLADAKRVTDASRTQPETKALSLGVTADSTAPMPRTVTAPAPSRAAGEQVAPDSLVRNRPSAAGRAETTTVTDGVTESRQSLAAPTIAARVPAAPSTSSADKALVARGGDLEKDADRFYSQAFANVAPEQLRAKAAKVKAENPVVPVLANFQIQQTGNELRVIDSDGSTYLGEVNATPGSFGGAGGAGKEASLVSFENADQRRLQSPVSGVRAPQQPVPNYQWQVEGTNRTLNQKVVFTWNFIETNALAVGNLNYDAAGQKLDASKLPSQFPAMLQNSLINGRAQFGPGQEIEVNAVPVRP